MAKGYKKSRVAHHGKKKRATRKRDGQTWNPTGGTAVSDKQFKGDSGKASKP